ncbi:MAG: hypothetical protein H0T93_09385 [Chloroflexia bacterium]|nr:hypothetical protein [Chloroflexia bacterium]
MRAEKTGGDKIGEGGRLEGCAKASWLEQDSTVVPPDVGVDGSTIDMDALLFPQGGCEPVLRNGNLHPRCAVLNDRFDHEVGAQHEGFY